MAELTFITTAKRTILMTFKLFALLLLGTPVFAEGPCANIYIYDGTIKLTNHSTPADLFARNSIEEKIKTHDGLCFKGYVKDSPEWQAQSHQKNDVLLSYTVGTLDDGNGVGEVGKTIEVVTYDVYSWDGKLNHIVNSGPDIAWFALSRDTQRLQMWADSAAVDVVFVVALMSVDGRQAK